MNVSRIALAAWALSVLACQRVPADRYGIEQVRVSGAEQMDDDALKNCLVTQERDHASLTLGLSEAGECGEPPFDGRRKHLDLWYWPWTIWPLYDALALEKDKERVERWYAARGFHDARVVGSDVSPAQATRDDTIAEEGEVGCERLDDDEGCTVSVHIQVEEGQPTRIVELELVGIEQLPEDVREALRDALELQVGERFDEALYDRSKQALGEALGKFGYAKARVDGQARVHRVRREARVRFSIEPGPVCVFGDVEVVGADDYMVESVRATSLVRPGDPFSTDVLRDVRQAVFGMGSFSSVLIEPVTHPDDNVVDLTIEVSNLPRDRFGIGVGAQAGVVSRGDGWGDSISVPQWDVHLIARYTRDRVLRGPRRFKVEDRPAMITQEPFPGFERPRFGNLLRTQFLQHGVFEPRITMTVDASYDYGPDYFDTFFRHLIDSGVIFSRFFFLRRALQLSAGVRSSVYRVNACEALPDGSAPVDVGSGFRACELTESGELPPVDYQLAYLVERVRVDLRDDDKRPHGGALLSVEAQQSMRFRLSSWSYVRLTPDARFYIPLPVRMTLALRFAVGAYFIRQTDPGLDELSQQLGPRELRLRGGGASSNRGFAPGQLGDGDEGGIRRWEASLEWRVPVMPNMGLAAFVDAGDVSRQASFRFDHPQLSSGFGFRLFTPLGPIRLDLGWQLPGLQVFGEDQRTDEAQIKRFPLGRPGTFHFSIGEAF